MNALNSSLDNWASSQNGLSASRRPCRRSKYACPARARRLPALHREATPLSIKSSHLQGIHGLSPSANSQQLVAACQRKSRSSIEPASLNCHRLMSSYQSANRCHWPSRGPGASSNRCPAPNLHHNGPRKVSQRSQVLVQNRPFVQARPRCQNQHPLHLGTALVEPLKLPFKGLNKFFVGHSPSASIDQTSCAKRKTSSNNRDRA